MIGNLAKTLTQGHVKALNDFGIALKWKYVFLGPGTTVNPMPNTIFVDLGNQLAEGVIDTHHSANFKSSAHALQERPDLVLNHLLKNLNEAYARGEEERLSSLDEMEFTFVTHTDPDWDGVATYYLCKHLLNNGCLPPPWLTELLINATNLIDQGKGRIEGKTKRPYLILYAITSDNDNGTGITLSNEQRLIKGCALIETIINKIKEEKFPCCPPENPFLKHFDNLEEILPDYTAHLKHLAEDRQKYEEDVVEKAETFEVELPFKERRGHKPFERIKAIAFTDPPSCMLHKDWARDNNEHQLLLVPRKEKSKDINRWIISVNPRGDYTLHRLGYLLEKAETAKRSKMGDAHMRHGEPRWLDEKYSDNSNPWYDGRNHECTIVDSPRCASENGGTKLSLPEIKDILEGRFHGIRLEESPNNNLSFYFFFEISEKNRRRNLTREDIKQLMGDVGLSNNPVLAKLDKAFQFIKHIELRSMEFPPNEVSDFKASLWASEITRHCVLQLKVKNFHQTLTTCAKTPLILEELAETIEKIEKLARETADTIGGELNLEREIWGQECFRLLELNQPDLQFHSESKVRNAFDKLLRDELPKEQFDRLISGEGTEQLRTSHALCVLNNTRKDTQEESLSQRQLMLFYSLFLKTGYRNFSARISNIVDMIIEPNQVKSEYDKSITEIQEDYSAFLGRYEFSEREINTDDGLQKFFKDALKAMGFREQQAETRHEMSTTFELAAAKKRIKIEEVNMILNYLILGLGILALGDFLYAWFTNDRDHLYDWFTNNKLSQGIVLFIALSMLAGAACLGLWKYLHRKRNK